MKGKVYKTALKMVGLSINKAGPFLGITSRQSFRVAAGDAELPGGAEKLLRLMMRLELTAANVDHLVVFKDAEAYVTFTLP